MKRDRDQIDREVARLYHQGTHTTLAIARALRIRSARVTEAFQRLGIVPIRQADRPPSKPGGPYLDMAT